MRGLRLLLWLLVSLAVIAGGLYLARLHIASAVIRSAMASAGLENPKAQVTALAFDQLKLTNLAAGPRGNEGFNIEQASVAYDLRTLVAERKVKSVAIGPGSARLKISDDGAVTLPGVKLGGGESAGQPGLPFEKFTATDIQLLVDAPEGEATGLASADYDLGTGGAATLELQSTSAGYEMLGVENARLQADIDLAPDGQVVLAGSFTGDAITSFGRIRDLDALLEGNAKSWRRFVEGGEAALTGEARILLRSARASLAEIAVVKEIATAQSAILFGDPVSTLSMAAGIAVTFDDDALTASIGDTPIAMTTDTGAELVIAELDGAPLYVLSDGAGEAGLSFTLNGAAVSMAGTVNASQADDGWSVYMPVRVGEYQSRALSIDEASAVISADIDGDSVSAEITTTTKLRSALIGRFRIADAPLTTNFLLSADRAAKRATVRVHESKCIALQRAQLTLVQQDTEATLKNARLCGGEKALVTVDWAGALVSDFAGVLVADDVRYRLGQTRIAGRPPEISFSGIYQPTENETDMSGVLRGGSMLLNEMLRFSNAEGRFEFSLDKEMMRSESWIDRVRITQNVETPQLAPVYASGKAALTGQKVDFEYWLDTPEGARLGGGEGVHNVASAKGASTFTFDRISFEKEGVQPDKLAPVLKGFIGQTVGEASGSATFDWSPSGVNSAANFIFDDVTFGGPTRVVTLTTGLNGNIKFASLWPVTTDGPQTITVDGVDLDALQLERGEVRFDMPGDETLRVEEAQFPWFGGELGVYKANASLAGGEAVAPLRATNIDLKEILEYIDVDGLSGEGILSGVLPLVVEDGKARIENGVLKSEGAGAIRYKGKAAEQAAGDDDQAQIAFDLLRDLRYTSLGVTIDGPLDGRLNFQLKFEGDGEVALNQQNVRVPVIYRINLDAALLELLNQAVLTQDVELLIQRGQEEGE